MQRLDRARHAPLARVLALAGLVLLLQVPVGMVRGVIAERDAMRQVARAEVTGLWGAEQTLTGPWLAVPYRTELEIEPDVAATKARPRVTRTSFHLPERLSIEAEATSEVRYRGIFQVPVYLLKARLRGSFAKPVFDETSAGTVSPLWHRAQLGLGVSGVRSIQNQAELSWNGATLPFSAGSGVAGSEAPGLHVALPGGWEAQRYDFTIPLELRGSLGVRFAPFGRQTRVDLRGDWPHPSFQGAWLPASREIRDDGFEARWQVPSLGRNFPQRWTGAGRFDAAIRDARFGADWITPVDPYRMAERSSKYAILFLTLTFLSLWLFEVRVGLRVHPIQYLLVGAALCLFFLLELALAEHLGFGPAYALAASLVVALLAAYAAAVLRRPGRGALLGGGVTALYAYLYVLLSQERYALLAGSLMLTAVLAAVMAVTRRIDWYDTSD